MNQQAYLKFGNFILKSRNVLRDHLRHKPVCVINTNLTKDKIPETFGNDVTKLIANVLSKPENFITVSLKTDKQMWKNGSSSPLASVDIWSIGVFNKENNDVYTPKFFKFFSEKLGLPEDRIVMLFHPLELEQAGHLTQLRLNESNAKKQT